MTNDPTTPAEWQNAVDVAHVYLMIDSAKQYGLVDGGPAINVDRCEELITRGREHGIVPRPEAVEEVIGELMRGRR